MPDYQKMYYAVCAAASRALDAPPVTAGTKQARAELKTALLEAEDIYIDTSGLIQLPATAETGTAAREQDILARLRSCAPKDKQTALQTLEIYLCSLGK